MTATRAQEAQSTTGVWHLLIHPGVRYGRSYSVTGRTSTANRLAERVRSINPHAVDGVLALAFTGVALWTLVDRVDDSGEYRDDDVLGIALVLLQTLPIAARSVAPLAALAVSVAAISLHIALGYEGVPAGTFAALIILYSAASLTDTREALLAALIAAIGITIYFTTDRGDPGPTAARHAPTPRTRRPGAWACTSRSRREYTERRRGAGEPARARARGAGARGRGR